MSAEIINIENESLNISPKQLELLWHTLGLSPTQRTSFRNHFLASNEHQDIANLRELEDAGMMTSREVDTRMWCGNIAFYCTDAGRECAMDNLPPVPKRTRYQEYLASEYDNSFADYLGIDKPQYECAVRHLTADSTSMSMCWRMTSRRATGEWCVTKKAAKTSYKQALSGRKS